MLKKIKYKGGYKYQLVEKYSLHIPIDTSREMIWAAGLASMSRTGFLKLEAGYAWNGPSGPTIDTKNFIRGSLVHDAMYQMIRHGMLDTQYHSKDDARKIADKTLRKICKEDGMSSIRASWVYYAVRLLGKNTLTEGSKRKIEIAP